MLAPDPDLQNQLKSQAATALPVTIYCQIAESLLPAYTQGIDDASIQADLDRLQTHVGTWSGDDDGDASSDLCDKVSGTLPREFVTYGTAFLAAESDLQRAASALKTNVADSGARDLLSRTIGGLLDRLNGIARDTEALRTSVAAFLGNVQTDLRAIQGDVDRLAASTHDGHVVIQELTSTLTPGFVQPSVQSPCEVILTLDEQVALKLTEVGASLPNLVGLVFAQTALDGLTEHSKAAQGSLDSMLDGLSVLSGKYASVKRALDNAEQSGIPGIVVELDIDVAVRAWGQLRDFASSLIPA